MSNKKILYIRQQKIPQSLTKKIQQLDSKYDYESMLKVLALTSQQSFYNRAGDNTLPFCFDNQIIDISIPAGDCSFKKTFEEITDQRCMELLEQCNDRPWIVSWSGGIDSTVILASLLKNASKSQLDNVIVSCNNLSVLENPVFFHNHVLPNFKIINGTSPHLEKFLDNHYIIDGNPADLLQGSGLGLLAQNSGLDLGQPWQQQSGPLNDFLSDQIGKTAANWLYSRISQNILSLSDHTLIDTLADWFWWINFNWKWVGDCWYIVSCQDLDNITPCFTSFKNWYDTEDYQQWSINYGRYSLVNDGPSPGDYKKSSKQYIYDYDGNQYYYRFKTKTHSTARVELQQPWLCMLNDGTTLSAEQDLDLILELLPAHLNL